MKRILLLVGVLVSLTAAHVVFAQTEGVINYEVKVNLHRNIPKEREQMRAMVPEFRTHGDLLVFNSSESLYKPVIETSEEEFGGGGGMRMQIKRPLNEHYVNRETSRKVMLQEFMGKNYLLEDSLSLTPWKIGTETKEVQGYLCRQATFYNEERKQNVVVWYTDKLRPFLGPENFNTLPGAVLQVDINDGERTITAKQIELRPLRKNELKMPSKGIKTTPAEMRKLMDEQFERMKANGGNVIIQN